MKIPWKSFLVFSSFCLIAPIAQAEEASKNYPGSANLTYEVELPEQETMDPEKPEKPADAGESPKTDGYLRIDHVPKLDFGRMPLSTSDQFYSVYAQLFHDDTPARPNFVQVTDSRATGAGWTLQVRQETPFLSTADSNNELKGAYISLDKSWVSSVLPQETAPLVVGDVIKMDKIGMTYDIAKAGTMQGVGTWSIVFGASSENEEQETTLKPAVDEKGQPILDPAFKNKQKHENRAVTFFIPGATEKKPGTYQTMLTWILSELP